MLLLSGAGLGAAGDVYPKLTQFALEIRARNIPGSTNAAMASSLLYTGLILKNWTSSGMGSEILHHVKVQTNRENMSAGLVREVTLNAFRSHGTQIYSAGEAVPLYGARPSGSTTPGGGGVSPGTPTYPTATGCLNRGGTCMDVNECTRLGRTSIVNLCPGTPNNIRCCLPSSGQSSGGSGGGQSAGGGGAAPPLANDPGSASEPWGTGHYVAAGVGLGALIVVGIKLFGKKGKRKARR